MPTREIPAHVAEALHKYHDADQAAQRGYVALCDAARRGDAAKVKEIESGRASRRYEQDRSRHHLDEVIRGWL